jgi:hypothetical protein
MKKNLFLLFVGALLMVACATPEERAARQAENLKMVKAAVGSQQYRINVSSMTPMRGTSTNVMGRWVKIDGNTIDCYLPYVGRDDAPHMKTRAEVKSDAKLEFKAEVENYNLQYLPNKKCGVITFTTSYGGDDYQFNINVDNTGRARIRVTPKSRDFIDYEGSVYGI